MSAKDPQRVIARLQKEIERAVRELETLRQANAELRNEVAELAKVARQREGDEEGGAAAWASERVEIRERVEGLVGGLERLLASTRDA